MNSEPQVRAPEHIEDLERYWTDALAPLPPAAGIVPDYPRPATPAGEMLEIELSVPAALAEAALAGAQSKPSLLLAMLATACTALVHKQTGAEQVCLLTPVAHTGPSDAGTNRWLAVKNGITADGTLTDLLDGVRRSLAAAFSHQQFPFARLLDLLGRAWPVNRAPLSDIAVAVAGVSRMDVLRDLAADVTILGAIGEGSLDLSVAYRPDLFAADSVRSFGQRLVRVMELMLDDPRARVSDLRLLTPQEESAAIARFCAWDDRALPERRLESLIEEVARTRPNEPACVHGAETLTYGDLVAGANALASELRRADVQPGQHVGVALDLGLQLPVALLGTLLSGAAFVPLDPRQPIARLQHIASLVSLAGLLVEPRLRGALEPSARVIDWDPAAIHDPVETAPVDAGDARAPAYVMFTSGSTGEPNGVSISHRSLVNYLLWARQYYLGAERPSFALYSSIGFDLTLTSIFLPLIAGGSSVIFTFDDGRPDMEAMFADPRVGAVKATPSHLKLLRLESVRGTRVRRIIVGGEALDWELAAALQDAVGDETFIFNEYGPTEATIACTAHRFTRDDRPGGTVPIGDPIWNTGIYLLDDHRRPAPAGVPAQLWISGVPVAEGYVGRPERTAERFFDDPFKPGHRMYRTGDQARVDAAGRVYYLGRGDDQVKFNGVRIELSEIRAAINRLPRVRDSVVRVLHDERRNQVLTAYYVARQTIDVSILRAGLIDVLPDEMIPGLFVRVSKLPLTLNGKVDVERLPSLDEARSKAPQLFVAPRTRTETVIAEVWREVLSLNEISVHSNFFALGGHSLLASQVAWKTTERLGVDMPVRLLFDSPTIARLSAILDQRLPAPDVDVS